MQRQRFNNYIKVGLICLLVVFCAACGNGAADDNNGLSDAILKYSITIVDGANETKYTLAEMLKWEGAQFEGVYSVINNWPTKRFDAAQGIKLVSVLEQAGVLDKARVITIIAGDGYICSFTKEQLLADRYYFPKMMEGSAAEALPLEVILAYRYAESGTDIQKAYDSKGNAPMLIYGQTNPAYQNSAGFVANIDKIIISAAEPEKWAAPSTYPLSGSVGKGDTVKIEHKDLNGGFAKIYYTLDGSDPSEENGYLYNPSTYQPELLTPIPVNSDITIKVVVIGLGKYDSDIKTFKFTVK